MGRETGRLELTELRWMVGDGGRDDQGGSEIVIGQVGQRKGYTRQGVILPDEWQVERTSPTPALTGWQVKGKRRIGNVENRQKAAQLSSASEGRTTSLLGRYSSTCSSGGAVWSNKSAKRVF
jgi:hypothetical protein